jgi:hypothetical protein
VFCCVVFCSIRIVSDHLYWVRKESKDFCIRVGQIDCTVCSVLYIVPCTQHLAHYTLCIVLCTLYLAYCTLYIVPCTQHLAHYTLCIVLCT